MDILAEKLRNLEGEDLWELQRIVNENKTEEMYISEDESESRCCLFYGLVLLCFLRIRGVSVSPLDYVVRMTSLELVHLYILTCDQYHFLLYYPIGELVMDLYTLGENLLRKLWDFTMSAHKKHRDA